MEALKQLKSTEPPQWLAPSESLSETAREVCSFLFASLKSHAPKSPLDRLLVEGFDAEQIWQQIDLQSQPLLPDLRRQVAHFQKNPDEIGKLPKAPQENGVGRVDEDKDGDVADLAGFDSADDDDDDEEEEEEEEDESEDVDEDEGMQLGGIEDKFFKMDELEEYLEEDEAREYGLDTDKGEKKKKKQKKSDDDEFDGREEEEDDDDDDDDDEVDIFGFGEGGEEDEDGPDARYDDFFNDKKSKGLDKKSNGEDNKGKGSLSTHEKQLQQKQAEIEKMEKANMEPKIWTMQGEVTASKRPVNSALEVDLDFEHNVQPPPVITEEISASLEVMIKKRIEKGLFDDIQKVARLTPKAPKENKEIDDKKSKKGLAEVYEEEYVQKTNPFSTPMSFSDELKKEASVLFKKLCSQLDALSHFHFAPKPVIEDMSIQTNVPALAMEEIAPMAVSDAAMLAPEEVFSGKGDIKEEAELTKEDRNRRRAKKKRKFKAEEAKRTAKKPKTTTTTDLSEDDQS